MSERIFEGKKIYYSGSIRGVSNSEPDFAWKLVGYMANYGANVLSEHVAAPNREIMVELFAKNTGIDLRKYDNKIERAKIARRVDLEWVREATHLVALVTNPSLGVGIEIQETVRKPDLGFNQTPMLFLVSKEVFEADKLSNMVTGIDPEKDNAIFEVGVYESLEEAQGIIYKFLKKYN